MSNGLQSSGSGPRRATCGVRHRSAARHRPGGSVPSSTPPNDTRSSRVTSCPTAANSRRISRLRPSTSSTSRCVSRPDRLRSVTARGATGTPSIDDAARQRLERRVVDGAAHRHDVDARHGVGRIGQRGGQPRVGGEQEQAARRQIEPADRLQVRAGVAHQIVGRRPPFGIAPRRHDAARLVQQHRQRLGRLARLAVDRDPHALGHDGQSPDRARRGRRPRRGRAPISARASLRDAIPSLDSARSSDTVPGGARRAPRRRGRSAGVEERRFVRAQPSSRRLVARAGAGDERPEARRVVRLAQVHQLVDQHVVADRRPASGPGAS